MFTFCELGLELVSLFPEPGVVDVTLLEFGDDLGVLLLLRSLCL